MTVFIDGKKIAQGTLKPVKAEIARLAKQKITPHLGIILVGNDPQSMIYVKEKQKKAQEIGLQTSLFKFKDNVSQDEITFQIDKLNQDPKISGILIQLPLPQYLDTEDIINKVEIKKDVDGLRLGSPYPAPCVSAILKILKVYKIDLKNKKIVIVGIGRLVGRPLFRIMQKRKLNAKLIRSRAPNFKKEVAGADILICASKNKNIISLPMIKKDAAVIDAACNVKKTALRRASYITPQTGGVGPITVAILLKNVVKAACLGA